ncbi:MAG: substrate-binding domain-containing protein [Anaerolineales bacterium]
MGAFQTLHALETLKLLADPRRMEIMRLLMASASTLTQLAGSVRHSPAWVRHHLKILESAGLIEIAEIRTTGKITEKFYRAKADVFVLQAMILPKTGKPAIVFSGSHDLAIDGFSTHFAPRFSLLTLPVGSLDGLLNLRQGLCQIAGAHLLDENGEYNTPYIRHFFPDRQVHLLTLAHRTQGLMFRAGNPKEIRRISDLARADIRFVNRNAGSGTRVWLDLEFKRLHISPGSVRGYTHEVHTHTGAAALIRAGKADTSLGLQAAAYQYQLDFLPLFEERYDLVLPHAQERALAPLLDYIQTANFRRALGALTGYNTAHSGEQIRF